MTQTVSATDFVVQPATTLPEGAAAGATNIKVAGVAEFAPGQTVTIGSGPASETAVIASVGTAGSTRAGAATQVGDTVIPVAATAGFVVGQSITIDSGANQETATIAAGTGRPRRRPYHRDGAAQDAHPAGTPLAGSGITLTTPLAGTYPRGAVVTTDLPTPGAANKYPTRARPVDMGNEPASCGTNRLWSPRPATRAGSRAGGRREGVLQGAE